MLGFDLPPGTMDLDSTGYLPEATQSPANAQGGVPSNSYLGHAILQPWSLECMAKGEPTAAVAVPVAMGSFLTYVRVNPVSFHRTGDSSSQLKHVNHHVWFTALLQSVAGAFNM